ncbi:hypothetical protein [Sulfolobus islandicus rod-shaped virus 2]|uniref:56B-like ribbon-helix-helix domain-containing protein n=1 Tax=Sulfolobus islandicus rod-shaped virus 2 TaxID=157899 RepID=Q8V9Q3_SIRV2|nr:Arc-like repressor [Sulfolobus islandicus rod-shaped virus 2]CAC87290.1 hypothetical protein [Sulfolobus islandicus rod-shaped virus 2]
MQTQEQSKQKKQKAVFGIYMDKDLKTRLKVYCAKNNLQLTQAIEEAIKEYLQKRGG